jgi:hypothetical protein
MRLQDCIGCKTFPCQDINPAGYTIPAIELDPQAISVLLISEAAPPNPADFYYAPGDPAYQQTTVLAFNDAGLADILKLGVYLTTAVKCAKTAYGIQTATIKECSFILEDELALFPNVQAYLLMGDVAIKAFNEIALRAGLGRVIPAGSTYKLREAEYFYQGARVFPSYLQVGPSFNIEKSKRRMIAEDIAAALGCAINRGAS